MANRHSHVFQYAMSGTTECFAPSQQRNTSSLGRKNMYQLAASIEPEQLFTIAKECYRLLYDRGYGL